MYYGFLMYVCGMVYIRNPAAQDWDTGKRKRKSRAAVLGGGE
jgi:hypothetical protein